MLRSLFGKDWRKSPAHLLLLSHFLDPREDYKAGDLGGHSWVEWSAALRESPRTALQRCANDEALERVSLEAHLGYKYSLDALRRMVKQYGLPVVESKEELIAHLVQADPKGMNEIVSGLTLRQCSRVGHELVKRYLDDEKDKRVGAEQQTMEALRARKFKAAARAVAAFEAAQVFPRNTGADWKHYDAAHEEATLGLIFSRELPQLKAFTPAQLEEIRRNAAMQHLWGYTAEQYPLPQPLTAPSGLSGADGARLLLSSLSFQAVLAACRESQSRRPAVAHTVSVHTRGDKLVCNACRQLARRTYLPADAPELPHAGCTCEQGCRCTATWHTPSA
jgi:hypothetical protein